MPIYGPTLMDLLKERDYVGLPISDIKSIMQCVFTALAFLDSQGIIHTDVKPENVLLKNAGLYKQALLIDYGCSCYDDGTNNELVTTEQYRAPEVEIRFVRALGGKMHVSWNCLIDVWSAGCLAYELMEGSTLFTSEDKEIPLIHQMRDIIGPLPYKLPPRKKDSFLTRKLKETPVSVEKKPVLDFICEILVLDPTERLRAEEVLKLPFLV
jgi:serine/threonine protein kinase